MGLWEACQQLWAIRDYDRTHGHHTPGGYTAAFDRILDQILMQHPEHRYVEADRGRP